MGSSKAQRRPPPKAEVYYKGSQLQLVLRIGICLVAGLVSAIALVGLSTMLPFFGGVFLPRVIFVDFATVWFLPLTPAVLMSVLLLEFQSRLAASTILVYDGIALAFASLQAASAWYVPYFPAHSLGPLLDLMDVILASLLWLITVVLFGMTWVLLARQRRYGNTEPVAKLPSEPHLPMVVDGEKEEDDDESVALQPMIAGKTQLKLRSTTGVTRI